MFHEMPASAGRTAVRRCMMLDGVKRSTQAFMFESEWRGQLFA
jgi:hypothetical protein